jgi:EAL domain-containing protein (putative c-di-GMP-specific phosphodiesterase class I)/CheY-like chemotaxis protein
MIELGLSLNAPAVAADRGAVPERKSTGAYCLIVDDEKSLRSLIARSLRQRMVMTEECGDAISALRAIKHRTPDLIFLDVSLERSDAIEVIRGLGEMQYSGVIQLMSGRDLPLLQDIKRVGERHSLKMLPVLQKPFRVDAIPAVLLRAGISPTEAPGPRVSLFDALCAGWLELCYQPTIELRTMQLIGAEGLARVNHPEHGVMVPGAFLPGAEEASLLSLAEFAIVAALRDWSEFAEAGASLRLSVNVPLDALVKLPIAALVREHRPMFSSWPGLILEVSEDQLLRDIRLVYELATQLSIYDVHLAIDRFGYAHTALTQLLELPRVELKLARGFVVGCAQDRVKRSLCGSVIELAHKFKRQVIAVGVDQLEDLQALTRLGCDQGQGMLLGPPLPRAKLRQMIKIRGNRK